jgi:hypothetical protein
MGAERTQRAVPLPSPGMARPARDQPLRAAPRFTPVLRGELVEPDLGDDPDHDAHDPADRAADPAPARRSRLRSALLGVGVGVAVGVAGIAMAFSVLAIPLFFVASTEPGSGTHRDLVFKGLFYVALPFGVVVGVLGGIVAGIWYGRGGRLPEDHR